MGKMYRMYRMGRVDMGKIYSITLSTRVPAIRS